MNILSSGKMIPKDKESVRKRLAAFKSFMETRKKDPTLHTLDRIVIDFHFGDEKPKRGTISKYLKELHYDKVNGFYVYVEPSDVKVERQKQTTEMHRGLLKNFIQPLYKGDVFWLPLAVQPGYAEGVAASLKQVYPKKIFGCIAAGDAVFVAFIHKTHREFVWSELQKLTGVPAVKPKTRDRIQLGGKEKQRNS